MPNVVSLTRPSLQTLSKVQKGVFCISGFLVKFRINENRVNPSTSNDIDMKLRPVTKPWKYKYSDVKKN